jgi:hypothetical protein
MQEGNYIYIVQELCAGGDISDLLAVRCSSI